MNAIIFDIQSHSVHDGPGCRTTVFFAGCPLRCKWCCNPESHEMQPRLMIAASRCKYDQGCRACAEVCSSLRLPLADIAAQLDQCVHCPQISSAGSHDAAFPCLSSCPSHVFKQCLKSYSVDALMQLLLRDHHSWGSDGGVTFSGGECMLQHEVLKELLLRCHDHYIPTAVETSAHVKQEIFLDVMRMVDFAFVDVKQMDSELHRQETGVGNELILSNIRALRTSGFSGRLVLRQPIIGGFNDSDANALSLIGFMQELGLYEINLLPFHRMGASKWTQLGKSYPYQDRGDVTHERLNALQSLYLDHGIACYIGDNTPF